MIMIDITNINWLKNDSYKWVDLMANVRIPFLVNSLHLMTNREIINNFSLLKFKLSWLVLTRVDLIQMELYCKCNVIIGNLVHFSVEQGLFPQTVIRGRFPRSHTNHKWQCGNRPQIMDCGNRSFFNANKWNQLIKNDFKRLNKIENLEYINDLLIQLYEFKREKARAKRLKGSRNKQVQHRQEDQH